MIIDDVVKTLEKQVLMSKNLEQLIDFLGKVKSLDVLITERENRIKALDESVRFGEKQTEVIVGEYQQKIEEARKEHADLMEEIKHYSATKRREGDLMIKQANAELEKLAERQKTMQEANAMSLDSYEKELSSIQRQVRDETKTLNYVREQLEELKAKL